MIEQYFPSVRPIKTYTTYTPPNRLPQPVLALPGQGLGDYKANQVPSVFETSKAERLGLSIEEYRRRCGVVARAQTECKLSVGDIVWPTIEADFEQYGMCTVVGVCRHYNDYGEVEWREPPYILSVQQMSDRSNILNCTGNWVSKARPLFVVSENLGDC
jgi:hypothetical protein